MLKAKSLVGPFSLLLVLLLVNTCSGNTGDKTVVVFQDGKTLVKYPESSGQTTKTPSAFNAPSFVGGIINSKEFLAIISSARLGESSESHYTDVVVRTSHGDSQKWTEAERFTTVSDAINTQNVWGDTTAVMKGNKIYVLITSMGDANNVNDLRDPVMIEGTVKNRTEGNIGEVYIEWGATSKVKEKLPQSVQSSDASKFMGGEGNGLVTGDGKIIFPIVMIQNGQKIASTLYCDDGDKWHIGGETESETSDGSLVQWGEGKLLFTVASQDGLWKVFESDNFGLKWNRSPIFFGVWGSGGNHVGKENPGSVIKVPVDNKDVLLFAYPQNKDNQNHFDTLQLWLSDGQRIACIGTISDENNEKNTGHSVLAYVKENLYITQQINPPVDLGRRPIHTNDNWKNVIGLTLLPDFFENVKTTVLAWRRLDDRYKSKGILTDALVGFLGSTKADDKLWTDMYNCVNASVTGGKIVSGGFQFDGAAGSGAKWPVISQGQNQVYKFTEKQFTLAATVIIHKTIETEGVFLLGASGDTDGRQVLIGLGYTKDMQWYLMHKSDKKIDTTVSVELDKEYHVAITLENNAVSVYVGETEIANGAITLTEADLISHFFMGGTGISSAATNENLCTVKSVMLFSKALGKSEITQLTKVQYKDLMNEDTTEANARTVTDNQGANSRVTTSRDTGGQELTPGTNPINTRGNDKTISGTGSTNPTENIQSMPTKEPKEASGSTPEKATNEKNHDKKINNALHGNGDAVLKKNSKSDNGAALSVCALAWICFVCSLIALMGF